MRKWFYIFLMFLPLLGCSREEEPIAVEPVQEDGAPDGYVSVTFSCSLPDSSPATKSSLGETSGLESMHLAVFGGSGYYKEYVTATLIESHTGEDGQMRTFLDVNGNPYSKKVDYYVFEAKLKLSNTPRTIHFLGNGPKSITIGKSNEVLPKILCNDSKDDFSKETAFWQMIWLPGIMAATDEAGNYLTPSGEIRQPGQDYQVSPETLAYFQKKGTLDSQGNVQGGIALIRNWAKIILRNNWLDANPDYELDPSGTKHGFSNFIPHSFAIIHYPERGTIVPYGANTKSGFIGPASEDTKDIHYQTLGFEELYYSEKPAKATTEYPYYYGYKGNLPEGTPFNHDIPSEDDFVNGGHGVVLFNRNYDVSDVNTGTQWYDEIDGGGWVPTGTIDSDKEPAAYMYERPVPTADTEPSFVIIYGKYINPKDPSLSDSEKDTGVMCYYKIDLMDGNDYYPIFRNFKYQIQLRKITSRGHDNPRSAAESAGSANVSADVTVSHLADISDGKRRMAIKPWMSWTFIEGDPDEDEEGNPITELPEHLYVKFLDDITLDDPIINTDPESVWAEVTPAGGGVIENDYVEIGAAAPEGTSEHGWRPIRFKVCQPDQYASKTQTLRICCKTNPDDANELPLYRDIVLTLQPKQTMEVTCKDERVLRDPGTEQVLNITIPAGLVESMFPLVFTIEPQEMTLTSSITTTANNQTISMPVVYGPSINPNYIDPDDPDKVTKTRFQFERTVSWEEYNAQRTIIKFEDESRWKTFECYFKTNCEYSATEIWVANKFFNSESCSFGDFRSFKDPRFTTSIPRSTETTIPVSFTIFKEAYGNNVYKYPNISVKLEGLTWDGHQLNNGVYTYTPEDKDPSASKQEETLTFRPTVLNGKIAVTLSTPDGIYEPVTIKPWHFTNVGFISAHALPSNWTNQWGSNVVFDMVNTELKNNQGKSILFGFCTDPDNPEPYIEYKKMGDDIPTNITTGSYNLKGTTQHVYPYSGRIDFYWQELKYEKTNTDRPVQFWMSSVGYVEERVYADRFTGAMQSLRVTAGDFKSGTWYQGQPSTNEAKTRAKTLTGYIKVSDCWVQLEISDQDGYGPAYNNEGLVLSKGKTYDIKVNLFQKSGNNYVQATNYELLNLQFEYYVYEDVPQGHLDYEVVYPAEDGYESSFYQYMGANYQYIWSFPRHFPENKAQGQDAHLRIRTPNSRDTVISVLRVWAFRDESNS